MNIIKCENLTKEYMSGDNVVCAVDNVTTQFEQGEFCAITGPSGSGKSTFLHVLSSLENPTNGSVIYGDKKLSEYNDNQLSILRRRRFGFVFQAYNLVSELTGYENNGYILKKWTQKGEWYKIKKRSVRKWKISNIQRNLNKA